MRFVMNKTRSALAAIFLGLSTAASATEKTPDLSPAQQEILKFEQDRLAAFAKDDKPVFTRMMADEAVITHGSGSVMTKADELSVMRPSTPEHPLPVLSVEDPKVQLCDNLAVLTGNLVETAADGRRELVLRFTNTYVKRDARWQLINGQLTTLSRERAVAKIDPKVYAAYVGEYKNPSGRIRTISADGGKFTTAVGAEKVELFPQSENQFFIKEADVLLVFVKDEQGRVISLINRRPNGDVAQETKIK
jgi:hypothetical protein